MPLPAMPAHGLIVAGRQVNSKLFVDSAEESGYDALVRKGVDHIGVGAGAVIMNDSGEVFLAQRGPDARNEKYRWEFPGGSVEFGETLEHALVREINEEYGIQIEVGGLLDVVDHILPDEGQHWVSPTYLCRITKGEPTIREPRKCLAIGWFRIDAIPVHELSAASRKSLESFRRFLSDRASW